MKCFDLTGIPSQGTAAQPSAVPQAALPETGDWDLMFRAVIARLRTAAGQPHDGLCLPAGTDLDTSMSAVVLDCARALEGLHSALRQARSADRALKPARR